MYIFKEAFEQHRPDKTIFMGFGLKHLEDVSKYYVSPRNEGGDKTYMAQMIGEGVNLLLDVIQIKRSGIEPEDGTDKLTDKINEISCDPESSDRIYAMIFPHRKWYEAGVIDEKIACYEVFTERYSDNDDGSADPYVMDGSGNKGTPIDRYKDISVNTSRPPAYRI